MCGAEMNRFCARHSTGRTRSSGSTIQPTRQPVMLKYLEKLLTTMALGLSAAAVTDRLAVVQAVIDLVADQPHAVGMAPRCDGREFVRVQHRPGRGCWARRRRARPAAGPAPPAWRRSAGSGSAALPPSPRGPAPARRRYCGRAGSTARAIAIRSRGVERGQEGERERRGGAHGDGDATRVGRMPIPILPVCGDARAQRRPAQRLRVAERPARRQSRLRPPPPRPPARQSRAGPPPCGSRAARPAAARPAGRWPARSRPSRGMAASWRCARS